MERKRFESDQDMSKAVEIALEAYREYITDNTSLIDFYEDEVIRTGKDTAIVKFAKEVPGANIEKLENVLIERKSSSMIRFAAEVPGANIEKLEDVVVSGEFPIGPIPIACAMFAMDVPGANVERLQDIAFAAEGAYVAHAVFAKFVKGADREKAVKLFLDAQEKVLSSGEAHKVGYYGLIGCRIGAFDEADITRIENLLIELGNGFEIQEFADYAKGAHTERLYEVLKEMGYDTSKSRSHTAIWYTKDEPECENEEDVENE